MALIQTALLGAGMMGHTHSEAYLGLHNARVAWVFDRDLEKARRIAERHGAQATDNLARILEDRAVQAVDICLPTDLHREFTERAAAAGKHVFSEKPMARSIEDAQAMIDACRKAGVKLMVGHVLRFFAEYTAARRVIRDGQIGEAKVIRATRAGAFPTWSAGNWYADYSRSGGPIVDLIVHDIDFIRWTFGEVERVYARCRDHYALVVMRLESGAICHVEGSWAHPPGSPFTTRLEVAGTKGLYTTDNQSSIPLYTQRNQDGSYVSQPESPFPADPYALELKAFYDAIESDTEPPVSGEDALRTLRVVLAGYTSAQLGQPVAVKGDPA